MTNKQRITRIKQLRADAGWTQEEAAKQIEKKYRSVICEVLGIDNYSYSVTPRSYRSWENGARQVPGWVIRVMEMAA